MADDHAAANRAVDDGKRSLASGNLDRAIAAFTEAIRLDATNAHAYCLRGRAREQKGDHKAAVADCTQAVRLDPTLAKAYIIRPYAHNRGREYDEALAIVGAIRLDAKDPDAYHERALAYADKGDLDRAMAAFTEAIRLDRKPATAYENRGLAYRNKGQFDEAIADFTEVIRLDPKMPGAFADRASVRIRKREFDAAIGDYTEATRLAPSDWRAYFGRFSVCREGRSTAPSRTSPRCSSASDLRRSVRIPRLCLLEDEEFDKAVADFTAVIRLAPKGVRAYQSLRVARN